MDSLIKNAVSGQRKAMLSLYESNKQSAYQVAYSILGNEESANNAVSSAFKSIFDNIKSCTAETVKDFSDVVIKQVAESCKRVILKKNSRAYQFPAGKNFSIKNPKTANDISENYAEFVFGQFTELQQLIFVLHTVGQLDNKHIASVTKLDAKTVDIALKAEKENVENIVGGALTYEAICESYIRSFNNMNVSSVTDNAVRCQIAYVSAPLEKSKRIKLISIIAGVLAVCLLIGGGVWLFAGNGGDESSIDESATDGEQLSIDMNKTYYADIDIKDYGKITVKLDQSQAPITVDNFVKLSKSGFYDGLTFHRVVEGFMMQGGDPDGTGGGGYVDENGKKVEIKGEFSANGVNNTISHTRGVISMARANPYDSASSQFFIVHEDSLFLDGKYAGFGYVTEGLEVVDKICTEVQGEPVPEDERPIINKITIREE